MSLPHRQLEAVVRHGGRILARVLLKRGRYTIGQERKYEISVDQESISSRHARLTVVSEAEIYIEDYGSANGTFVDGQAVTSAVPVSLSCLIHVGECALAFQRCGLPAAIFDSLPTAFFGACRYVRGDLIIQGRTSAIHTAHDTLLQRAVAFKMMLPESQASPAHALRFIREAQIVSQLEHPSIPPIYDFGVEAESRLYYTTRFIEGESLSHLLRRLPDAPGKGKRNTLAELLQAFKKVCDGISYAHSRGVTHCSLRPENIVLGDFGEVLIINWMFAALLEAPQPEAAFPGTARRVQAFGEPTAPPLCPYTAPALAKSSDAPRGEACDLHALAGILYSLVTLQPPAAGEDEEELRANLMNNQPPPALEPPPHWSTGDPLPERLVEIALETLSSSPTGPASVLQFHERVTQAEAASYEGRSGAWKALGGLLTKARRSPSS